MKRSAAIASARAVTKESQFNIIANIIDIKHKNDWRLWEDAESNILRITQNGGVKIYQGKNPTTTRDVFRKANPNIIAKHSYWVLYLYSPEQIIIAFLGNDGLLRCSLFKDNKWVGNQCPIFLGFKILKIIASGYIDPEVKKIVKTNVMSKNLQIEEAWSSGYPISDSKLQEKLHCLGIS